MISEAKKNQLRAKTPEGQRRLCLLADLVWLEHSGFLEPGFTDLVTHFCAHDELRVTAAPTVTYEAKLFLSEFLPDSRIDDWE